MLAQVLFATETLAMGLNLPARTVVFASATKWDLASLGQATLSEPIVHLDLREDWKQDTIHLL